MDPTALLREFLRYCVTKLEQNRDQIVRCTHLLSPVQFWYRPNEHTNSIANLILHLTGNVRQWLVSAIGGQPFLRNRPAEFAERGPRPTAEILAGLEQTVREATTTLLGLDPTRLDTRHVIQGYDVSTLVAITHVVEHFSFHTGQIIHTTKTLLNIDLSRYDDQGRKLTRQPTQP